MKLLENIFSSFGGAASGSKGVVGIDIGSSSIKVVALHDNKGVVTLAT